MTLTGRAAIGAIHIVVGERSVMLCEAELEQLLAALAGLDDRCAESVADDLVAFRLAGPRIRLLPTERELAVLRRAAALAGRRGDSSVALMELARLCKPTGALA